jgi:RNA polymerase sigma factor (sigma-70 family)
MDREYFLNYIGKNYDGLKKKYKVRLNKLGLQFSDDIFHDTIIKATEHMDKYDGDPEAYFYQSFLTNTRREGKYAYHKKDDSIDILTYLDNFPNEDRPILLEDIEDRFKTLTEVEKHIFMIYFLTDLTFPQLEELTGIKDLRYQMKKIIKKIRK